MTLPRTTAALAAGALALSLGPLAAPAATSAGPASAPAAPAAPAAQEQARQESGGGALNYSPRRFVGGQALTFSGRLKVKGKRPIRLQQHMNRPGDTWFAVRGFSGRSNANGSFRFQVPAPSMFGISYRVVSKGIVTPKVNLSAKGQDLTVIPTRTDSGWDLTVNTTPAIQGRPETRGLPTFRGRTLTLQRRDPSSLRWSTVGTARVQGDGKGLFRDRSAGVYRVRQEAITTGRNRIGWYPSFPVFVGVQTRAARSTQTTRPSASSEAAGSGTSAEAGRATTTAASRYRWGRAAFDFAWERAESLTAGPAQGTRRKGRWEDFSNGTGRVAQLNGGLALESGRQRKGGDHLGDTHATLRGNARSYGRWETRLRESVPGAGRANYTFRVQLVPERTGFGRCSTQAITLAEIDARSRTMRFGVRKNARQWTGTARVGNIKQAVPALAVEVTRSHITWFLNGRVIGTVRNRSAISSAPKTLRLSLVGRGNTQMNSTFIISDWQRGYDLTGRQIANGKGLRTSRAGGNGC